MGRSDAIPSIERQLTWFTEPSVAKPRCDRLRVIWAGQPDQAGGPCYGAWVQTGTMVISRLFTGVLFTSVMLGGCKDDVADDAAGEETTGAEAPTDRAAVVHSFGTYELQPLEEIEPCIQWTLNNEQPIYVNTVTLVNSGGYHHSNWFVVPEDVYPGPDGFFECGSRGFHELESAVAGTVLFAQSTQSRFDQQELPEGVVIKIPARHKLIAGGHLLNLADAPYETELRMTLDIIHPRDVRTIVAPFRLTYFGLDIPPLQQSRFSGNCDIGSFYQQETGQPIDLKLYYVTPHYHYLGNYFDLSLLGGPDDGRSIFRLEGFNADGNGQAFDPPIDISGAQGFRFTCGYDNWRDRSIGWGIGDQEMCVMLGLADSAVMMDASVPAGSIVGEDDGILLNEGPCTVIGLPKNEAQSMPTPEEIEGPLYVPPSDETDADLPPVPACEDTPADAQPQGPITLSSIRDTLFVSSCTFSSCHASQGAAANLDLLGSDLHDRLLNHEVVGNTSLPLVEPGDPEGSWLYQRIAACNPRDDAGMPVTHMPLNAPTLSDPRLVAKVRAWIEAGAPND